MRLGGGWVEAGIELGERSLLENQIRKKLKKRKVYRTNCG